MNVGILFLFHPIQLNPHKKETWMQLALKRVAVEEVRIFQDENSFFVNTNYHMEN